MISNFRHWQDPMIRSSAGCFSLSNCAWQLLLYSGGKLGKQLHVDGHGVLLVWVSSVNIQEHNFISKCARPR